MTRVSRSLVVLAVFACTAAAENEDADKTTKIDPATLRDLDDPTKPYKTPRAGEGFRTNVFGEDVVVEPRNRRSTAAFDIGLAATIPGAQENEILPFASFFFWERPDDKTLLRATVVGVYNEIFYAKSPEDCGPIELVATFENQTVPFPSGELIDGKILRDEKIYWGYVRPGIGFGYRQNVAPGAQDNMFAVDLTFEPGFLYFARSTDTKDTYQVPDDTFEPRGVLRIRYDALERNLLELPHAGFALGSDLIYGYRVNWSDYGTPGTDRYWTRDATQDYINFRGYAFGTTGSPFTSSDRHRVVAATYGGVGDGVDRFSATRVGGGPDPRGEEYGSLWRPFIPGAVIGEFAPEHYAIGILAYRWEPIFFTYLGVGGVIAYLDRERASNGTITQQDDILTAVGLRLTSGFIGETRIQIGYSYNFDVFRQSQRGGHEVFAHLSKAL